MKKTVISIFLILIIVCIGLFAYKAENENLSNKPLIKIGVTLPLTGDVAFAGTAVKNSVELALRDVQKDGSLKYDYELVIEDDKLENKNILMNYSRFKNINKVQAVLSMWSKATAISPLAEQDGIIHLGCAWGYQLGKGHYNFNHSTFPEEQSSSLITELKKHNVSSVGLIYSAVPGDQEIVAVLRPKLVEAGIRLVFDNRFNTNQKDFRMEITKMKAVKADAVINLLYSPAVDVFMKQADELAYYPKYAGLDTLGYKPELFENHWYVMDATGTEEFIQYYKNETGNNIASCVANLYDGLKIVVEGFERAGTGKTVPENSQVADAILNLQDFESVTGKIYIDSEGNIHTEPKIAAIKNGKAVVVEFIP